MTLYFLKVNPGLVERRLGTDSIVERQVSQKIIVALCFPLGVSLFVIPSLDHRFHWSVVPLWMVLLSDVLIVLGLFTMFLAFRENSYASRTIGVERGQPVISTGPYALVRHPMYSGMILMYMATPTALGSFWTLAVAVPVSGLIVVRLIEEERHLSANLPGYDAYRRQVLCRLIQFAW